MAIDLKMGVLVRFADKSGVTSGCRVEVMETRRMRTPTLAMTLFLLGMANPRSALCQNDQGHRNDCAVSENLKIKKSVPGTYTEEATTKNAEGTVVLCLTVDGHGMVTDVSPISGPRELL